ncbi:MAG: Histidyl-tRNA synthetase [candidate division WS6 bacterium GW2011_GWA2_37_6]|uniref:Histidine--tRNA ligase n=1 Tax=candidate division WS6 bacterium GW2011_GWA2_37_6 TaxID=1619087 RepID=A0A0G0H814_9BACT|nr:MAG: Histidyl-tRNA synthetase [candidate division WS6 bacterium GW2011_GWA2_37_6]
MKFNPPKGTIDITGEQFYQYKLVADSILQVLERYGFTQVRTPVFDDFNLLAKDAGEEVEGQIYRFKDKAGRDLAIKSDITPALTRLVGKYAKSTIKPIKYSCYDRVYRYERPQKGRYREITQINGEMFGVNSALADMEILNCLIDCYSEVGLDDVKIYIGCRPLLELFIKNTIQDESKVKPVIRLLDKVDKISREQFLNEEKALGITPKMAGSLDKFSDVKGDFSKGIEDFEVLVGEDKVYESYLTRLKEISRLIDVLGLNKKIKLNLSLARGSEYYTGIIFEARYESGQTSSLSIGGGGRYDNLVKMYGGPDTPAVGFSIGIDRLILLLEEVGMLKKMLPVIDYALVYENTEKSKSFAVKLADELRKSGFNVDISLSNKNTQEQIENANAKGVKKIILIKDNLLKKNNTVLVWRIDKPEEKQEIALGRNLQFRNLI